MQRVGIALAALLGFAVVFIATWVVGIGHAQSAACDGVCVDEFPVIGALAIVLGVLGALVGGFAASAVVERRFGDRRADRS